MKLLTLTREASSNTETLGVLSFGLQSMYTIERPWIPTHPGGKPGESCVPAGQYELIPHTRPNGDKVLALINPGLGVYYLAGDRFHGVGRYLILIHAGNWAHDVIGCIAPGLSRATSNEGPMVTKSRDAMEQLMDFVDREYAEILIR